MNLPIGVKEALSTACTAALLIALFGGLFRLLEVSSSSAKIRKYARSLRAVDYRRFQESEHVMPVSLILPAAEGGEGLKDCIDNLLSQEFRQFEVIVIANSGRREEWERLIEAYRLLPFRQPYKKSLPSDDADVYRSAKDVRLVVLDQKGACRASALNAGVNVSSYPIVAVTHERLRLSKNAMLKAVYAFVSDSACAYIGSFPRAGGKAEGESERLPTLSEYQNIERLRTLYSRGAGYTSLGMYLPRQPVFGAFLKSAVMETGGFSAKAALPEADLLLRVHMRFRRDKRAYCARLLPDAVCVQLPEKSMRAVCASAGTVNRAANRTIRRNGRQAALLPGVRYTRIAEKGWPLVETAACLLVALSAAIGAASVWFFLLYLLVSGLFGAAQSVAAVLLEENAFQPAADSGRMLRRYLLAVWENFGYRQRVALARIFSVHTRE